jgi:hypothetical protein
MNTHVLPHCNVLIPLFSEHFLKVINRANQEPVKKYTYPQTESQEYGWITKPLVSNQTRFIQLLN